MALKEKRELTLVKAGDEAGSEPVSRTDRSTRGGGATAEKEDVEDMKLRDAHGKIHR